MTDERFWIDSQQVTRLIADLRKLSGAVKFTRRRWDFALASGC